jgi:peptidoglycan/xylan/chitin deacetylase (PgdA/CDA1 family)
VAFRLDDIQDYWITPSQEAVIDIFKADQLPLTIGIIANAFGDDDTIVSYVQQSLQQSFQPPLWDFEIANHGWNHEYFDTFTLSEQENLLSMAIAKTTPLLQPYGFTKFDTFIPPYNAFDSNTITALELYNFKYMTSQTDIDLPPYVYAPGQPFYHWPIGASTDNMDIDYDQGVSWTLTLSQIQDQIANYGFSVVMMHPQEYSNLDVDANPTDTVNQTMINNLKTLIQQVQSLGIKMVSVRNIETTFNPTSTSTSTTGASPRTTGSTTASRPLTTGSTTASRPLTTGSHQSTTGARSITTGSNPLTTGANHPATTGTSTSTSTSGSGACTTGNMQCLTSTTYQTCAHNVWGPSQPCGTGLQCHASGNYIYCY